MTRTPTPGPDDATDAAGADEAAPEGAGASQQFMRIGEVAARTELSLRSLRHWEEVGLVLPSGRTDGGFRLYTEDDVEKILLIRRMKPLGFSLDRMKKAVEHLEALRDPQPGAAAHRTALEALRAIRDEAAERRAQLVRQLAMADEFVGLLDDRLA